MSAAIEHASGLNQRQQAHRNVWQNKATIRLLYRDFHRRLLDSCPEGRLLDIGGGTAHIKEIRQDVISTDILSFPGIDLVSDAHRLPFPNGVFAGVVMLDVLHHLERPVEDELPFDVNPQLAAVLLELPGVQSAARGQTQIDAIVTDQILRPLWF